MLARVLEFCDLDFPPVYERRIRRFSIRNSNDRWTRELTPEQQTVVQTVLTDALKTYGYA